MIQGERNPPERKRRRSAGAACDLARARIDEFLGGDQPLGEDRALRAHLEHCEPCNALYRERLVETARVAREQRLRREARAARGAAADSAPGPRRSWFRRRFRLGVVPLLVFAALAVVMMRRGSDRRLEGRLLEGRATTSGRGFDDEAARTLGRGEWLVADEGARLALESDGTRVVVLGGAHLWVEEPETPRFRIQLGRLEVDGPCAVVGEFGGIEFHGGAASLDVSPGATLLVSHSATADVIDSGGVRRVLPGERLELVLARP